MIISKIDAVILKTQSLKPEVPPTHLVQVFTTCFSYDEPSLYGKIQSVFLINLLSIVKYKLAYARPVCQVLHHHVGALLCSYPKHYVTICKNSIWALTYISICFQ
jgi:hypothetical protein